MKRTWIVLCQEVVRDGRTGEEAAGNLVGIRSDCEVIEYKCLDDAAAELAATTLEVRLEVPQELGWNRWREIPPLMREKFRRLVQLKQNKVCRTVPVGMALAKVRPHQDERGWSILFVAFFEGGEHAAPDLESLADMIALDEDVQVGRLDDGRPDGAYDLPEAWRNLLIKLVAARRMAAQVIERARK